MSAPPYMKLFWGDYHRDTRHLTRDEHGAYFLLLGEAWNRGGLLPDDDALLARWALATAEEWARLKPVVMALFKPHRGRWRHKRIAEELTSYDDVSRKRKEAGRKGGSSTRGKHEGNPEAIATANAEHKPTKPEPEPEPIEVDDDKSASGRFQDWDEQDLGALEGQLREAAGSALNAASPRLCVVAPILALLRPGAGPACDLLVDVLPAIRASAPRARKPVDRWDYFVPMIAEARDRRLQGAPAANPDGCVVPLRPGGESFADRNAADIAEARRRVLEG